jgi:virginiamycin B lyase
MKSLAPLLVLVLTAAPASAGVPITWHPQSVYPNWMAVGRDGIIYMTDLNAARLGTQVPGGAHNYGGTATHPSGLAAGLDGALWYGELDAKKVVRYDPYALFATTEFPVPNPPHHFAYGADGNVWYTSFDANAIGRLTRNGTVTEFTAGISPNAYLWRITVGADGALWFTEGNLPNIGRITTTGVVTEYAYPTNFANARGITLGPDGNVWFCENTGAQIGRITTAGTITEFPVAHPPSEIVAGLDGALWFTAGSYLGRITTSGVATYTQITGHGTLLDIVRGPDGAIWFGTTTNELGRVVVHGDAGRDGTIDVSDVFYLINFLFAGGTAPK